MIPRRRCLLLAILCCGATLHAHTPHDIVHLTRVSPTYDRDQVVAAVVELSDQKLFSLSSDGGRSFRQFATPFTDGSRIRFEFSPAFVDDGTLFAVAADRGLFRSGDGGFTWRRLPQPPAGVPLDIAISPAFAEDQLVLCMTTTGCYRSINGGDAWQGTSLSEHHFLDIVFAPTGGGAEVYAMTRIRRPFGGRKKLMSALHRSIDGGVSWSQLSYVPEPVKSLAVSPRFDTDRRIAACFGGRGLGVLVSNDGGSHWIVATRGLTDRRVNEVAIADDGTMFAVTRTRGCFRADGGGEVWTRIPHGFEALSDQTPNHFRSVAVSPSFSDDSTVFVGAFEGLYRSTGRGDRWTQSPIYGPWVVRTLTLAPTFAEQPEVFVGSYGAGAILSRDGGQTWKTRSRGLETLFTSILEPAPTFAADQTLFYAHRGLWQSRDLGRHWTETGFGRQASILRSIGFSPQFARDGTMFAGANLGCFRSTDRGETWEKMPDLTDDPKVNNIVVSPRFAEDRTVYVATKTTGVWRSQDAGDTWHPLCDQLREAQVRGFCLSPAFEEDQTMFLATTGGLLESRDAGTTWKRLQGGLPQKGVVSTQSVVVSPKFRRDTTLFLATQRHGLFRSGDGGQTFVAANQGIPRGSPRALAISPAFATDRTVYLATYDWVYRTVDAGENWTRLPGYLRIDDSHPMVRYDGLWGGVETDDSCGPGFTASAAAGAWTELEFRGYSIEWFARRGPDGALVQVLLDGEDVGRVDLRADEAGEPKAVFSKRFSGIEWHRLRIVLTSRESAESIGSVRSDGFSYSF